MVGSKSEIVCDEQRLRPQNSEVERLLACNRKAHDLLGWTPRVDLEEGLRRTIAWFEQHHERYKSNLYNV